MTGAALFDPEVGYTDFLPEQVEVGAQRRSEAASRRKLIHDRRATSLPPLDVGQDIMIQNPHSLRWDACGRVKECRDNGRSYLIEIEDKVYLRNRRFLRPVSESQNQDQDQGQAPVRSHQRAPARDSGKQPTNALRHSNRLKNRK